MLGAEMLEYTPATGVGAVLLVVQMLLGLAFVVVPLGILIYIAVLLRRLTKAVQRIEHRLDQTAGTDGAPSADTPT